MQRPALIDERAFPSYASTIKMTGEKKPAQIFDFVSLHVFKACNTAFRWEQKLH